VRTYFGRESTGRKEAPRAENPDRTTNPESQEEGKEGLEEQDP
tara:strand:- start:473 stop:601 length:129 start_codon:yes stop_codon:yes gene_type:complete